MARESLYDIPKDCICMGDGLMGVPCPAKEHARLKSAITSPKPLESPQEIEKALEDLYKPRDKHDEILFKSGQNHFNEGNTEHPPYPGADTWADIMTNQGWVYAKRISKLIAARPAHIDTTAPVVLKPELQVAGEKESRFARSKTVEAWCCGISADHELGEKPIIEIYASEADLLKNKKCSAEDPDRCSPRKLSITFGTNIVPADWPKPTVQPNELAAAQASFEEWWKEKGQFWDSTVTGSTYEMRIARAAWNAQQAKIEALEQQILLIQSNASANYSAAENRTHAVEEELARVQGSLTDEIKIVSRIWDALGVTTYADAHGKEISQIVADTVAELGVTNRALELMCNDFNILEIHASQKFPSTVSDYLVAAREEKLKEVGQ